MHALDHVKTFPFVLMAGGVLGALACGPMSGEVLGPEALDEVSDSLTLENGLAYNGVGDNGLNSNGLNGNGLNSNGLRALVNVSSFKTWLGCPSSTNFALRKKVMQYIVSCALSASDSPVTLRDNCGNSYSMPGGLGTAPDWQVGAPTIGEQLAVSACLMSRVNKKAQHVQLSFRQVFADGSRELVTPASEDTAYPYLEGAFFGNLFAASPRKFSCKGYHANVAEGRSCTLNPGSCGFVAAGRCDAVCEPITMNSGAKRWGHCAFDGVTYNLPMTIAMKTKDTDL